MVPRPRPKAAPINAAAITMVIEDAFFPPANRKPTYAKHNVQRTMRRFMGVAFIEVCHGWTQEESNSGTGVPLSGVSMMLVEKPTKTEQELSGFAVQAVRIREAEATIRIRARAAIASLLL
jgi:hypothetical protein